MNDILTYHLLKKTGLFFFASLYDKGHMDNTEELEQCDKV